MRTALVSALAIAGMCPLAAAGFINISPIGGGLTLQSGDLGNSLFGDSEPNWGDASLASAHAALNASGVSTDGKVTIVPADTDHGLALLLLIDDQVAPGTPVELGHIGIDTVANSGDSAFVNDSAGPVDITPGGSEYRIASAVLQWNSNGEGDAFAWADLQNGNVLTYRLYQVAANLGLDDTSTFQFVTWNQDHWSVVPIPEADASFTESGDFGFTAWVVPAPATFVPILLPLLGAGRRRRL